MFRNIKLAPLFLFVSVLSVTLAAAAQSSLREKSISSLKSSDNAQMQRQRSVVTNLVRENFGYVKLQGSTSDLYYLQRIVDKNLIQRNETYDLQALGVLLGDVMSKNLALRWVVVEDRYGRSRALQYKDTDSLFFPLTMISRRFQNNIAVNVRQMFKETEMRVKKLDAYYAKYPQLPHSRS